MKTFKSFLLNESAQGEKLDAYVSRLSELGIKPLGNGLNSYVFQHPTMDNVAVKVFLDDDNGYREYLEFCIKHPKNAYATKVFDTEDFADSRRSKYVTHEIDSEWDEKRGEDPAYSIAFLEKLAPVPPQKFDEFVQRLGGIAGVEVNSLGRLGRAGWEKIAEHGEDGDLKEISSFLVSEISKGRNLDVGNRKNFMLRGGQIVFIDPFA